MTGSGRRGRPPRHATTPAAQRVDAVVKVGGGLLDAGGRAALDAVAAALADAARGCRIVVVPGGGPLADAVRATDAAFSLDDDSAHWMAVLAMDQMAHLLAGRIAGSELVESGSHALTALGAGRVPVLAPYRWLRVADPLPHSWSVTSDSIAAWVAGELGARRLVLVKPVAGELSRLVDGHFARALPPTVRVSVVAATAEQSTFARALEVALEGARSGFAAELAR